MEAVRPRAARRPLRQARPGSSDDEQQEGAADHRLPVGARLIQPRPFSNMMMLKISRAAARRPGCEPTEPTPPGQQRAADHDRGDGEELPADALGRLAGAELRRRGYAPARPASAPVST